MISKREEERNEKIIRGLMKLPPNRRCINCNSSGPQYVCTSFWTFVCVTCSGIHREFAHRVKSVSMAKFTSQEVNVLEKGGNQRARELFLKAWDQQRQRFPDNSNVDEVREFIKSVYVDKKYSLEKLSDRPPRDPQSLRSQEDETRRASSYHPNSQSPPFDFQHEGRHYGKHTPALTRKPGSDRGLYEGKLSSFLIPIHFSDRAINDISATEGSNPRVSDDSVSSGGDPFRPDILSSSSQRDNRSPFSETSGDFSFEVPGRLESNSRSSGERILHPQRTASSGSFGSDSNSISLESVNSMGLHEVASETEQSAEISHHKSSSIPSPLQSSVSKTFNGLDLFSEPFAPQIGTSIPPTISHTHLPGSSLCQSVNLLQQSVPTFSEHQPSQTLQPSSLHLFAGLSQKQSDASSNGNTNNVEINNNGGWLTFDMPLNMVPMGTENSAPAAVLSFDGNSLGNSNPFSLDQSSSSQDSASHESPVLTHTFCQQGMDNSKASTNSFHFWNAFEDFAGQQPMQNILKNSHESSILTHTFCQRGMDNSKASTNNFPFWNAFEDSAGQQPMQNVLKNSGQAAEHCASDAEKFPGIVVCEAGVHSLSADRKHTNPFDLPYNSDREASNMSRFWDMSSLEDALPNNQAPVSCVGVNHSWFSQNSVPSHVPGGVIFDPPSGLLGLIAPSTRMLNGPAQVPVGGNPFA